MCSRDWIPTTITTIQMVGVLFGAAVIGQLGKFATSIPMPLVSFVFVSKQTGDFVIDPLLKE